jgi:hypothetical protein
MYILVAQIAQKLKYAHKHQLSTVMANARNFNVTADSEGLSVPNEASPLLQNEPTEGPQPNVSERWHPARSSVSAFIDKNAGMLLVVAAQLFFSAMNVSVKFLNSLDEPVPTFEVCHVLRLQSVTTLS